MGSLFHLCIAVPLVEVTKSGGRILQCIGYCRTAGRRQVKKINRQESLDYADDRVTMYVIDSHQTLVVF